MLAAAAVAIVVGTSSKLVSWTDVWNLARFLPAVAMISVIAGQLDLLKSMADKGEVNLKARVYDFVHWLMLIGISVGYLINKGATPLWFGLQLILLAVIGFQIGVGLKNKLDLPLKSRQVGWLNALLALTLGIVTGILRAGNQADFGWGWKMESITAVIATMIVIKWISDDLKVIAVKPQGYPRTFFIKGVICNLMVFGFWVHVMNNDYSALNWQRNFGLSFNVLIGNIIYLIYWIRYEQRLRQWIARGST